MARIGNAGQKVRGQQKQMWYLAHVNHGVQRATTVKEDVRAAYDMLPSQHIDLHLSAGGCKEAVAHGWPGHADLDPDHKSTVFNLTIVVCSSTMSQPASLIPCRRNSQNSVCERHGQVHARHDEGRREAWQCIVVCERRAGCASSREKGGGWERNFKQGA